MTKIFIILIFALCMESVGFMEFSSDDVVRHPLVGRIVKAYEKH